MHDQLGAGEFAVFPDILLAGIAGRKALHAEHRELTAGIHRGLKTLIIVVKRVEARAGVHSVRCPPVAQVLLGMDRFPNRGIVVSGGDLRDGQLRGIHRRHSHFELMNRRVSAPHRGESEIFRAFDGEVTICDLFAFDRTQIKNEVRDRIMRALLRKTGEIFADGVRARGIPGAAREGFEIVGRRRHRDRAHAKESQTGDSLPDAGAHFSYHIILIDGLLVEDSLSRAQMREHVGRNAAPGEFGKAVICNVS